MYSENIDTMNMNSTVLMNLDSDSSDLNSIETPNKAININRGIAKNEAANLQLIRLPPSQTQTLNKTVEEVEVEKDDWSHNDEKD